MAHCVTRIFTILLFASLVAIDANAQAAQAQAHLVAAQAAVSPRAADSKQAFHVFKTLFDQMCAPPKQLPDVMAQGTQSTPLPRKDWYQPPIQIFDNLYFIGTKSTGVYAVNTAAGIFIIDTNFEWDTGELVLGLLNYGLEPENIKYIIVTHAHDDRYRGAKTLQDLYPSARIIMSQADWDVIAKDNSPAGVKPRKDMVATDGQKLMLDDVTITLYITPGHTPGTLSLIINNLTNTKSIHSDNGRHVASLWGGTDINIGRQGVQYYPDGQTMMKTYIESIKRFKDLGERAGVDVVISPTLGYANTFEKIRTWRTMNPDRMAADGVFEEAARLEKDPHPFVSKEAVNRFYTVLQECYQAHLAWRTGS